MPVPPGRCWLLVLLVATLALAEASATVFGTSASAAASPVSQVEVPTVPLAVPPGGVKKVMYYDGKTLARVEYGQDGVTLQTCRLFELDDEREAEPIIKAQGLPVQPVDLATMLRLISQCRELRDWTASTNSTLQWSASSLWSGIIPGTKWCGLGDIASSYEDLGSQVAVDLCCRAHDHCPVKLKAFRSGYGLVNFSLYTKSHCDCDRDFHGCLRGAKSNIADTIGNVYFNVIKVPCIRKALQPQREQLRGLGLPGTGHAVRAHGAPLRMNTFGGDRHSGIHTAAQLPRKLICSSGEEVLGLIEIRAYSSSSKLHRACNGTVFVVPVVLRLVPAQPSTETVYIFC